MFTSLLVYVDDIIIVRNPLTKFDKIKKVLHHTFQIKNLDKLICLLGLKVVHSKKGITVFHTKYSLYLIYNEILLELKLITTIASLTSKLVNDTCHGYTYVIGRLIYLTITRPDIIFITKKLSKFLTNHQLL